MKFKHSVVLSALGVAGTAVVAGCDAAPKPPAMEERGDEKPPIEGYEGIKLGSSFLDAVGMLGAERLSPTGINECMDDLPLKGCYLSPHPDAAPYAIEAGIPYKLTLRFNKYDKLTDVDLSYQRKVDITREECLEVHERTLDWITPKYGHFWPATHDEPKLNSGLTPQRNKYLLVNTTGSNFVTMPMRTFSKPPSAALQKLPIVKWDEMRYASLISHFVVAGTTPYCTVTISFSEPQNVERPPLDPM